MSVPAKTHQSDLINAALKYARQGWPVLPVSRGKVPLIKAWVTNASTDEAEIRQWWEKWPTANIGIVTGPRSGLCVVDIDRKGGVDGFASLSGALGADPNTDGFLVASTPTGGQHWYFQWEDNLPFTTTSGVLPGVDTRVDGGIIIASPSQVMVDDELCPYTWLTDVQEPPPVPDWIRNLASAERRTGRDRTTRRMDLEAILRGLPSGQRDDQIFRYACHLRGCSISFELALDFIQAVAQRCDPPFPAEQAVAKVYRAYDKPVRAAQMDQFSNIQGDSQ